MELPKNFDVKVEQLLNEGVEPSVILSELMKRGVHTEEILKAQSKGRRDKEILAGLVLKSLPSAGFFTRMKMAFGDDEPVSKLLVKKGFKDPQLKNGQWTHLVGSKRKTIDTKGFQLTDVINDIVDVAPTLIEWGGMGLGAGAGATAALAAGPALPWVGPGGAISGAAVGGAAGESANQFIGNLLGVKQGVDIPEIAKSGATGALAEATFQGVGRPLLAGAGMLATGALATTSGVSYQALKRQSGGFVSKFQRARKAEQLLKEARANGLEMTKEEAFDLAGKMSKDEAANQAAAVTRATASEAPLLDVYKEAGKTLSEYGDAYEKAWEVSFRQFDKEFKVSNVSLKRLREHIISELKTKYRYLPEGETFDERWGISLFRGKGEAKARGIETALEILDKEMARGKSLSPSDLNILKRTFREQRFGGEDDFTKTYNKIIGELFQDGVDGILKGIDPSVEKAILEFANKSQNYKDLIKMLPAQGDDVFQQEAKLNRLQGLFTDNKNKQAAQEIFNELSQSGNTDLVEKLMNAVSGREFNKQGGLRSQIGVYASVPQAASGNILGAAATVGATRPGVMAPLFRTIGQASRQPTIQQGVELLKTSAKGYLQQAFAGSSSNYRAPIPPPENGSQGAPRINIIPGSLYQ